MPPEPEKWRFARHVLERHHQNPGRGRSGVALEHADSGTLSQDCDPAHRRRQGERDAEPPEALPRHSASTGADGAGWPPPSETLRTQVGSPTPRHASTLVLALMSNRVNSLVNAAE